VWAQRGIGESETEVVWNAVVQLVQALRYNPEVEGSSLDFFTDIFLPAALWLWGGLCNSNEGAYG
jgi:hypothetical protein